MGNHSHSQSNPVGINLSEEHAILLHALVQSDEPLARAAVGRIGEQVQAIATLSSVSDIDEVRAIGILLQGIATEAQAMREILRRREPATTPPSTADVEE